MYNRTEIAMFMTRIFNEIDTTVGSTISIPQGGTSVTIVTKSVNFWSAWMKFRERVKGERDVALNVEFFKVSEVGEQPVRPIAHGSYNINDILEWAKANPRKMFYMAIRYRSKENAERGVYNFEAQHYLN
jgi:hypothetical protein